MSTINLDQLRAESAALADSHAPNTRAGYRLDWKSFTVWTATVGAAALPAAPETVLLYLTDLLRQRKITTVRRHAAAINYYHRAAGLPQPADYRAFAMLAGAQRIKCERPQQKAAITVEQLRDMCTAPLTGSFGHQARNRAILTLGFASALRRANLAALELADVTFVPEGLLLRIQREKNDRKGVGRQVAVAEGQHEETCAVRALRAWIDLRGSWEGPLFSPVICGVVQRRRLHPGRIAAVVKEAAAAIGLEPRFFAGHSMRSGFVTAALGCGVGEIEVAAQTGHRSLSSLKRYYRPVDLFCGNPSGRVGL